MVVPDDLCLVPRQQPPGWENKGGGGGARGVGALGLGAGGMTEAELMFADTHGCRLTDEGLHLYVFAHGLQGNQVVCRKGPSV